MTCLSLPPFESRQLAASAFFSSLPPSVAEAATRPSIRHAAVRPASAPNLLLLPISAPFIGCTDERPSERPRSPPDCSRYRSSGTIDLPCVRCLPGSAAHCVRDRGRKGEFVAE